MFQSGLYEIHMEHGRQYCAFHVGELILQKHHQMW